MSRLDLVWRRAYKGERGVASRGAPMQISLSRAMIGGPRHRSSVRRTGSRAGGEKDMVLLAAQRFAPRGAENTRGRTFDGNAATTALTARANGKHAMREETQTQSPRPTRRCLVDIRTVPATSAMGFAGPRRLGAALSMLGRAPSEGRPEGRPQPFQAANGSPGQSAGRGRRRAGSAQMASPAPARRVVSP